MAALLTNWLLTSPPLELLLTHLRTLLLGALRCGPIPRHIAFVMDGNRRYARRNRLETLEGHNLGFEAMARVLEICYKSGVQTVTIYAFSIENFKRSRAEVDALMDMARVKLVQLAQHGELFERFGARVRVLGQRELVRKDVAEAIDEAVRLTKHNRKAVLNVCFPYTSRDEITTAVRRTVEEYCEPLPDEKGRRRRPVLFSQERIARNVRARRLSTLREESGSRSPAPAEHRPATNGDTVENGGSTQLSNGTSHGNGDTTRLTNGDTEHSSSSSTSSSSATLITEPSPAPSTITAINLPSPESITPSTLTSHMYTASSPPLDLLIRTSGVERLSDFMLWQCHQHTSIVFIPCLWPEFDLWRFLPVLAEWQWWRLRRGPLGVEADYGLENEEEEDIDGNVDERNTSLMEKTVDWASWVGGDLFGLFGLAGGGRGGRESLKVKKSS